ncbi:class I SAM-dependent methyltransferase
MSAFITREITPQTGHVIELGPGTGVFTTKMIERGVRPQHLTLVEYSQEFVERLKGRFPGARVLSMDAARLQDLKFPPETSVGAVVSGLPLLTMPVGKVMEILEGPFRHLRPGGAFYQFTYMSKCPVPQSVLDHLDLNATQVDRTFRNLPPAAVAVCAQSGLKPITIESGPSNGSTRVATKPASRIQAWQSPPV